MKSLIVGLILTASLIANDFSTRYDVDVGMFGKVGYADVTLAQNGSAYEIKLVAQTTGTAATLTGERVDTYISRGHVLNERFIPDLFIKIKKTTRTERIQTYHFDHLNKEITLVKEESKWVSQSSFDPISFKIVKNDIKKNSSEKSKLDDYNADDVLSSYLNAVKSCNSDLKEYTLLAIGAHNKEKDVTLSFLDGLKRENVVSSFSEDTGNIYKLHVESINKEDETVDVLIALDNDGHMKEAVLGDVFWIGEVKAKRVYHQVTSK